MPISRNTDGLCSFSFEMKAYMGRFLASVGGSISAHSCSCSFCRQSNATMLYSPEMDGKKSAGSLGITIHERRTTAQRPGDDGCGFPHFSFVPFYFRTITSLSVFNSLTSLRFLLIMVLPRSFAKP